MSEQDAFSKMPEWVKWGFDGALGAVVLAALGYIGDTIRRRRTRARQAVEEALERSGPGIRELRESRANALGERGRARPVKCRLKVVRFLAALGAQIPYINVEVEVTNFEKEPLTLFVLSVGYLHITGGPSLINIELFAPDTIPPAGHKPVTISRNLNPNEIRALSDVPGRPAAEARSSVTALVNVKGRDGIASNELNETAGGKVDGDSPYLLRTIEEWDRIRELAQRQIAAQQERHAQDQPVPHAQLDDDERRVIRVFAEEKDAMNGIEPNALAGYLVWHALRAQEKLESLSTKGMLERLPDSMSGVWVYVPTAKGRRYLIDNHLI